MGKTFVKRVMGRLFPRSQYGPSFYRLGEFVTFTTAGFAGGNIPELLGRTFYEVRVLRKVLETLPKVPRPTRSLEIGCGYGRLSPNIADYVDEAHSVDINTKGLEDARKYYPQVKFSEASATDLPFEDDFFDVLVSWTVLQHVMPNLIDRAFSELNRVLKDSATVILCEATLHADNPQGLDSHTHDRSPEFYATGFSGRPMLASSYIEEIDKMEGPASPGRLMVFGPRSQA